MLRVLWLTTGISKLQQNLSVEVFAYSNNTLAIVGDDQLVQSIRAGNHTYFRLHSGSLVMSYGSSSVQVSVQQAPVLFLAFQGWLLLRSTAM